MTFRRILAGAMLLVLVAGSSALAQPFQGNRVHHPGPAHGDGPDGASERDLRRPRRARHLRPPVDAWITVNAYLFDARIRGRDIEFQVNPEFGSETAARSEVDVFAPALGRLPAVLLSRAEKVHVNAGDGLFGGNWDDRSFLIHTGYGRGLLRDGFLEEVLFHEGAHVSVDGVHASAPGWRAAQQADGGFVSDYARDHPDREDVAESVLPYFAVRFVPSRLSRQQREAIEAAIPNRVRYFEEQRLDGTPYVPAVSGPAATVAFEQPTYAATEGGAAAQVEVLLCAPVGGTVTIPLNTDPAGGVREADYTLEAVAPARIAPAADAGHSGLLDLTFAADTTTATLRVTALDDPEDDPGELYIVIIEDQLPSDVDEGTPGHTVVEFREHAPVTVSFAKARHTAAEGETAEVVVLLSAPVNREVTFP